MTFVPVATDGSFFLPACRMGNGFTIGKKGQELKFDDYDEALRRLTAMPTPRWRRRNDSGNRGIVAGQRWERISRRMIDSQLFGSR